MKVFHKCVTLHLFFVEIHTVRGVVILLESCVQRFIPVSFNLWSVCGNTHKVRCVVIVLESHIQRFPPISFEPIIVCGNTHSKMCIDPAWIWSYMNVGSSSMVLIDITWKTSTLHTHYFKTAQFTSEVFILTIFFKCQTSLTSLPPFPSKCSANHYLWVCLNLLSRYPLPTP